MMISLEPGWIENMKFNEESIFSDILETWLFTDPDACIITLNLSIPPLSLQ